LKPGSWLAEASRAAEVEPRLLSKRLSMSAAGHKALFTFWEGSPQASFVEQLSFRGGSHSALERYVHGRQSFFKPSWNGPVVVQTRSELMLMLYAHGFDFAALHIREAKQDSGDR